MIKMKAGLDDWEMNLIQGMINQLQIDFKGLQTNKKGKKNQINTTYKVMEVSVKLCAQLLGFENNQSKNRKDREITDTFALFLPVYCCTELCLLHHLSHDIWFTTCHCKSPTFSSSVLCLISLIWCPNFI